MGESFVWAYYHHEKLQNVLPPLITNELHVNKHVYTVLFLLSYRDSLIVALINCGTSVFAGMVIFAVLGYMAEEKGVNIEDVVAGGRLIYHITAQMSADMWLCMEFSFILPHWSSQSNYKYSPLYLPIKTPVLGVAYPYCHVPIFLSVIAILFYT